MLRATLLAALASGCATLQPPSNLPTTPSTCVDEGPGRVVDKELRELVTVHRGVRWFFAYDKGVLGGLAWLRADGELGFIALDTVDQLKSGDFGGWGSCTAEGEGAVRCFNGPMEREDGSWTPFWSVRVELSDNPRLGELERWEGGPHPWIQQVASDGERALVMHFDIEHEEAESSTTVLTSWDVAAGRPIAGEPVRLAGTLRPLTAWCAGTCTVVGSHGSSLVAVTVPDGRMRTLGKGLTREVLGDEVSIVRSGDSMILAWEEGRWLRIAALDPKGRVRGRSRLLAWGYTRHVAVDEGLLGLVRDRRDQWELITVSPSATIGRHIETETDAVGIVGAWFGDGILLAGLSQSTYYSQSDAFQFHSWTAEVAHRYVHATAATDWRSLLGDDILEFGDGIGGYDVAWLTRPGRAAIFAWGTGDARDQSWLIPVRGVCGGQ